MSESHKIRIKRLVDELFNARNLDLIEEFYCNDCTAEEPHNLHMAEQQGHALIRSILTDYFGAFEDLHHTLDDVLVEGNRAAIHMTGSFTHTKSFRGSRPNGKKVSVPIMAIVDFNDAGKIARIYQLSDTHGMLQQMNDIPAPAVEARAYLEMFFERVWHTQDPEAISTAIHELVSENCLVHGLPHEPDVGRQGFRAFRELFRNTFDSTTITVQEAHQTGDLFSSRALCTMKRGEREFTMTGGAMVRVHNGQICEAWNQFNFLDLLVQLKGVDADVFEATFKKFTEI